jgi:mitogen-activated protein kinase kinase kinase 11
VWRARAANVLLTGSPAWPNGFSAKVADFGLSRSMADASRVETSTYGTITHQPPETLAQGTVSKARPRHTC